MKSTTISPLFDVDPAFSSSYNWYRSYSGLQLSPPISKRLMTAFARGLNQSAWIALLLVVVLPVVMYAGCVPSAHSANGARPKVFVGVRFLALMVQFLLTIALCSPGSKFPLASIAASIVPDAAADASIVTLIDTDLRAYLNWYCAAAIILTLVELAGLALTCASLYGSGVDIFCEWSLCVVVLFALQLAAAAHPRTPAMRRH
jgi:hypothetical protein